jgi:hypothetical protein
MLATVQERQESDRAQLSPRTELQEYIKGPLEITDDVVGWWGVSFAIEYQSNSLVNNMCRSIELNIRRFHGWLETISPSKDQLLRPSVRSPVVV